MGLNIGECVQWASLMSDGPPQAVPPDGSGRDDWHLRGCVHRMTATTRRLLELPDSLGLPFLYGALRVCSDEDLHSFATSCCSCSMVVSCDTTDI